MKIRHSPSRKLLTPSRSPPPSQFPQSPGRGRPAPIFPSFRPALTPGGCGGSPSGGGWLRARRARVPEPGATRSRLAGDSPTSPASFRHLVFFSVFSVLKSPFLLFLHCSSIAHQRAPAIVTPCADAPGPTLRVDHLCRLTARKRAPRSGTSSRSLRGQPFGQTTYGLRPYARPAGLRPLLSTRLRFAPPQPPA
jgi:hypothetical protein